MTVKSMKEIISFSLKDTKKAAYQFAEIIKKNMRGGSIVRLKGELGAGKTVFARFLAEALGIDGNTVKSPTYTYLREYKGKGFNVYHFDFYRLEDADEPVLNEIIEIIEKGDNVVLIEWPEKIEHILPKKSTEIKLDVCGRNKRKITIRQDDC
ncbi:tRNA (adenosine(37)-N6)-threonylcarbamoyltransferase complex ATPase subunit type 1 TsaE [Candidatus Peregrinibacteria bacterium]|nr:tRNA (adenosine(37)-N6)-threonylcarbamoyltransferase complex ATPase subunit type 1 TsaE [Candidatus Peregrinibacteria bacterium]